MLHKYVNPADFMRTINCHRISDKRPGAKGRTADTLQSFLNAVVLGLQTNHQIASRLVLTKPLHTATVTAFRPHLAFFLSFKLQSCNKANYGVV